jgi:glycosyltransferase involved in cell wall biosynthesis
MRIAFISTIEGISWGGSEELWYRTAIMALKEGHQVMVNVASWKEEPEKIRVLRTLGAVITKRKNYSNNLIIRAINKIKAHLKLSSFFIGIKKILYKMPLTLSDFNELFSFQPHVICFSQGGTFDAALNFKYIYLMEKLAVPYYLISQHNIENDNPIHLDAVALNFIHQAKAFFFVSYRNYLTAERQLKERILNYKKISNPVNIETIQIKGYKGPAKELTMACVARLDCFYKGQDILIQALSNKEWENRDFMLTLFGKGPDEDYLQNLILFYHLDDKIKLAGHVNDIDEIWAQNQILILPSLSEGTPLALLEAMLSGRPALTTDVGDNSTYVIDQHTGFLAQAPTAMLLEQKLELVWLYRNQLGEMGKKAFSHAHRITDKNPEKTLLMDLLR